jgi:hypothetical protein
VGFLGPERARCYVVVSSELVRTVPYPPHIWARYEWCQTTRTFGFGLSGRLGALTLLSDGGALGGVSLKVPLGDLWSVGVVGLRVVEAVALL